jgi:hypothetical protein
LNNISGDNALVYVDYTDLLAKILQALQNQQVFEFSFQGLHLQVNIDKIATHVAASQVQNPLGAGSRSARSATVNISPGSDARFQQLIGQISYCIRQQLSSLLSNTEIEEFVAGMVTSLQALTGKPSLNFNYNFSSYQGLQKQRLTLNHTSNPTKQPELLLKFHKLTITVQNIRDFNRYLQQGINRYIGFLYIYRLNTVSSKIISSHVLKTILYSNLFYAQTPKKTSNILHSVKHNLIQMHCVHCQER